VVALLVQRTTMFDPDLVAVTALGAAGVVLRYPVAENVETRDPRVARTRHRYWRSARVFRFVQDVVVAETVALTAHTLDTLSQRWISTPVAYAAVLVHEMVCEVSDEREADAPVGADGVV